MSPSLLPLCILLRYQFMSIMAASVPDGALCLELPVRPWPALNSSAALIQSLALCFNFDALPGSYPSSLEYPYIWSHVRFVIACSIPSILFHGSCNSRTLSFEKVCYQLIDLRCTNPTTKWGSNNESKAKNIKFSNNHSPCFYRFWLLSFLGSWSSKSKQTPSTSFDAITP